MSLFDKLKELFGHGNVGAAVNAVLSQTEYHDLKGLVAALRAGGLDEQVQSWIGGGTMPVTVDQLKTVINNDAVQQIGRALGLPVDQTLTTLVEYLPEIVNKAAEDGTLPS